METTPRHRLSESKIAFVLSISIGTLLGVVSGVCAYAYSTDASIHDGRFASMLFAGVVLGAVNGFFAARRAAHKPKPVDSAVGLSLLQKYRPAPLRAAGGGNAGQYTISDSYLRELLRTPMATH